jgi:hypothetical protein
MDGKVKEDTEYGSSAGTVETTEFNSKNTNL